MNLGPTILKLLNKQYEPNATIDMVHKGLDLTLKTDAAGTPILLFLGKRDRQGLVKGERYVRRLKKSADGTVLKDHWDHKGKAT